MEPRLRTLIQQASSISLTSTKRSNARLIGIFFICILLVLFVSPNTHAQAPQSSITLDNQSGEPALVKVIGPTEHLVEVPSGQSRTVNVGAGEYYLLARYGTDPNRYVYSQGDPFKVEKTVTQYSAITITLHKVVGGNYPTRSISRKEFEKVHVAGAIPVTGHAVKIVRLRSKAKEFSSFDEIRATKGYQNLASYWNEGKDFPSEYELNVINGDRVVIDHATGLMWHQLGSSDLLTWEQSEDLINQLNTKHYAGFSDWRLPTIEELASLVKFKERNAMAPLFGANQGTYRSSDTVSKTPRRWGFTFRSSSLGFPGGSSGIFKSDMIDNSQYVRAVRSIQ